MHAWLFMLIGAVVIAFNRPFAAHCKKFHAQSFGINYSDKLMRGSLIAAGIAAFVLGFVELWG
jgi:hypothetical protein